MDARGELATLDLATGCDEPASLVDVARQWARARQDRIAYRFLPDGDPENAAEISYGDLDREARKIAAYLQDRLDPGERAMLVYRTGLEFVAAFLGCLYAGVIAVPTSPPRNVRQLPRLQVIEEDARPAVVLTSSDHLDGGSSYLAEGLDRLGVEMVATDTLGAGLADGWRRPEIDPHSLAFLQYTSGSTARPKGVMVSHGNLVYNEEMLARAWGHTDGARTAIACWTPLFHDMGLIGNVLQSLYVGAECALMTPTTFLKRPQAWLQAISHYRATTAGAPNFAYEYCARKVGEEDKRALDLSSWRVAFNAAEPVHRASLEAFAEAFAPCGLSREALYPCYGLAEATVFATGGALDAPPVYKEVDRAGIEEGRVVEADDQRDGAERSALTLVGCGGPWLDEELRVVDPETCEELPRGRVGEIWIAGAHVARGYWRNEEATRRTFRATLASGGDTTYMRTGDMGFVEDGQLYLTGRLKDMIICRGRNVHPEDVERQVQVEVPQVRPGRVAAFGVDRGGDEHLVVAAELRQPKASIAGEVTASILDCVTQAHEVSVHDIALLPKGVIPKTTSGKIQRARCRTLYLEDDLDPIVTWRSGVASAEIGEDSPPAETVIRKALERLVGPKARRLEPDRSLTSVGLDSLRAIELCNLLEADLGVEVPVSELLSGAGIGDLVERANGGRTVRRSPRPDRPERAQAPTADDPGTADAAAEPFPLNDLQQAYWAGRGEDFDLGGVAAHVYLELDGRDVNLGRLERAWNRLIERHDVLRTVVLSEGTQRVLPEAPAYRIERSDLRGEDPARRDETLRSVRERMSHQVHPLDRWPLFEIRASELDGGRVRVHVSVDLFLVDGGSLLRLMDEWRRLYREPAASLPPVDRSFRSCVLEESEPETGREAERRAAAEEYWRDRLPDLPSAPQLPLAESSELPERPRFRRRSLRLPAADWSTLKERARGFGLTPSGLLLTAYSEVLGRWSKSQRFCLNVTYLRRPPARAGAVPPVGQFASFDLLEVDRTRGDCLLERAENLQHRLLRDLDHRQPGGVWLLRELARLRNRTGSGTAMPVVFTAVLEDLESLDWLGELVHGISQTPQVWLDCQVFERGGDLVCQWDAVDAVFPPGMVDAMFGAFHRLLERLAGDPEEPRGAWRTTDGLPFLVPEEHREVIERTNDTDAPVPEMLLQELVTRRAEESPDRVAVIDGEERLSYGDLQREAATWASRLRDLGAGPEAPVAVVMEKGWEQVAGALAALRAGAPYAPLDPELPGERLEALLGVSEASLVLTQERVARRHRFPSSVRVLEVGRSAPEDGSEPVPSDLPPSEQSPDDMACLLFTSGSTGTPKGVMVTHRGLVNAIAATNRRFDLTPDDRVLALTPFVHDMAGYDLFGLLAAGGALVVPRADARREPAHWLERMRDHRVTIWNSVPAMLEMALEYLEARDERFPGGLRLAFAGGDWIGLDLPERLKDRSDGALLVSVGGPTETTLWNIWHPVERVEPGWRSIPYGAPIANTRYHVLNELLEERPVGVAGELWCAGAGVTAGYWRDEEKTARRYLRHPATGERIYGTGDLGRRRPDGVIEFLGRSDDQVQINGRRIEPGEIEATLGRHSDVGRAVVRPWKPEGRTPSLVAYVVPDNGHGPTAGSLKEFASRKLVPYKVPSRFVILDELPLTPNGKVDRAALPEPDPEPGAGRGEPRPGWGERTRTGAALERRVTAIVAEVMGDGPPPVGADFAELGASSVEMIRIANRLEETFGSRPSVDAMFQMESIAGLVEFYREHRSAEGGGERQVSEASAGILVDPEERRMFRDSRPGLRTDLPAASFELPPVRDEETLHEERWRRRSHRTFGSAPLTIEQLAATLEPLRSVEMEGRQKFLYASGGGLYPVQVYLHVKPGRVDGLEAGIYYYHPSEHRLYRLADGGDAVDRSDHWPSNRPIFDGAAFSIFLVASVRAVEPMYGERSLHFATIEAGLISQLLELRSPLEIGFCQIGDVDFDGVRPLLGIGEDDVLLHTLLGGRAREDAAPSRSGPGAGSGADAAPTGRYAATNGGALPVSVLRPRARLSRAVDPGGAAPPVEPADAERVLVTGATGFLGAFLVERLLARDVAEVCCLVRCGSRDAGRKRLEAHLRELGLWDPAFAERVRVVPGDLAEPRFGLDRERYRELAEGLDAVYHNAARVNWVEPYAALAPVNVEATKRLLRLATDHRLKPLHFTSSLAVFPFRGIRFAEDDALDHGHELYGGYAQSKWVAERAVVAARERGVPVTVYRPGLVSADTGRGRYNGTAFLENLIKGSIQLGLAPRLPGSLDMVPVDFVAEAMVRISRREDCPGETVHLTNPRTVTVEGLFRWLERYGYPLELAPFREWKSTLFEDPGLRDNALYPYVGFLAELKEEQATMVPHDDRNARRLLDDEQPCPPVDEEYLGLYIEALVRSGFLPEPRRTS